MMGSVEQPSQFETLVGPVKRLQLVGHQATQGDPAPLNELVADRTLQSLEDDRTETSQKTLLIAMGRGLTPQRD